MTFEVKMHGVTITAHEDGQVALHVGGASVLMSAADFSSIVRVLEAVASLVAGPAWTASPASPAFPAVSHPSISRDLRVGATDSARIGNAHAVLPATRGPGRPRKHPLPVVFAGEVPVKRGPGRPRKHPLPVAVAGEIPIKRGPGRPRKHPLPIAVAGETPIKRGPGRPRKHPLPVLVAGEIPVKRGPGRPRKHPLPVLVAGEAPVKRGPGRPRKNPLPVSATGTPRAEGSVAVAPSSAPVAAIRKERVRTGAPTGNQVRDQLDKYMRENPGPKTMEELVRAATTGAWAVPEGADARRTLETAVPRHRDLFVRQIDGTFIRRAELEAVTTVPGKLTRKRGDEKIVLNKPAAAPGTNN
ncbi:MAG: hypothetical protein ACOYOB_00335 [Myxococcota bacterium]